MQVLIHLIDRKMQFKKIPFNNKKSKSKSSANKSKIKYKSIIDIKVKSIANKPQTTNINTTASPKINNHKIIQSIHKTTQNTTILEISKNTSNVNTRGRSITNKNISTNYINRDDKDTSENNNTKFNILSEKTNSQININHNNTSESQFQQFKI